MGRMVLILVKVIWVTFVELMLMVVVVPLVVLVIFVVLVPSCRWIFRWFCRW